MRPYIQLSRKNPVFANATVDAIEEPPAHGQGLGKFRVTVWGKEPHRSEEHTSELQSH